MSQPRATLRWRLTLVYGAVALGAGLLLLVLSVVLVREALSARSALDPDPHLIVVLRRPTGDVLTTIGALQDQLRAETVARLVRRGAVALVVLGAAGVALAYAVAGRVLRPLQQITATARRLSAEQLDARIDLPGPRDELKELADTFDAMLGRLQAAFEAQRRFVADASHELRTPLAVMRTEIDVVLADAEATPADLRAAAAVVRDATERADRLVDSLLLLARSDRLSVDGLPFREPVALADLAGRALRAVAEEVAGQRLSVGASLARATVEGDPGLLERLVGNLVENAVRHNLPGGWLRVDTGAVAGRARLQVSNSGAAVRPEDIPGLFEPFRRSGPARTARRGAGLGLSIAAAVARVHGGSVQATAPPAGGLVVTVDLPLSQPAEPAQPAGPGADAHSAHPG